MAVLNLGKELISLSLLIIILSCQFFNFFIVISCFDLGVLISEFLDLTFLVG